MHLCFSSRHTILWGFMPLGIISYHQAWLCRVPWFPLGRPIFWRIQDFLPSVEGRPMGLCEQPAEGPRCLHWLPMDCCACMRVCQVPSVVSDSVTLQAVALQAHLCRGLSRQEYQSGLPCLPPGDLPDPGIEPVSLRSPALAGRFFTISTTWESL